jgi:hypothetical protein
MAVHKVSLVGSQDAVTSPLRAPFTEVQEKESPKKLDEKPRGEGLQRSVGELLTCKFCLRRVGCILLYLRPRARAAPDRLVAAVFASRHRLGPPTPDLQALMNRA